MATLSEIICLTVTEIKKDDIDGANCIKYCAFYHNENLRRIEIPYSVKKIYDHAFNSCTSLTEIDGSNMDPCCVAISDTGTSDHNTMFLNTPWVSNLASNAMHYWANGGILVRCKLTTPSTDLIIPDTVKSIWQGAFSDMTLDSAFKSLIIPDTVEMISGNSGIYKSGLEKIVIGSGVRHIGSNNFGGSSLPKLVFRQPKEMYVELPQAGDPTGIAYNKDSRAVSIYTDNECIKNYAWATDNVTATFYPLSQAPV